MSNKIGGYSSPSTPLVTGGGPSAGAGTASNAASTTNAPAPAAPSAGDTATVSSVAVQLAKLGTAVDQSSGVDSAKVASLQTAINNGTYQVNAQSVADKLLATQNEGQ